MAFRQLKLSGESAVLSDAVAVLVTVKSADTAAIAETIARHAPPDAVIVSLQNGVANVPVLHDRLPGRTVLAAMVPFNVISKGEGRFHRAISGDIVIERDADDTAAKLSVPGLAMRATGQIAGVQWGKLLVNLNNAINALSGLPLREQLAQRAWRGLFADQIAEGLAAMRAEGISPVSPTPVPLNWTARLLRLPDRLFAVALAPAMKIDPQARSSMWGRPRAPPPHRDRLPARRHHHPWPTGMGSKRRCRAAIAALIKAAEAVNRGSPAADGSTNPVGRPSAQIE